MTEVARIDALTVRTVRGAAVVEDVGLVVRAGETLGIVGRSGSGKTTTALALLGHVRPGLHRAGGTVTVGTVDPFVAPGLVRGRLATYLGQDPAAALNPARRIGAQLAEAIRLRAPGSGPEDEAVRLLRALGLPTDRAFRRRRPHQISGGQARRAALALALAGGPDLLVLDEPTAGLDPVLAASVRDLLAEVVRAAPGTAIVLVSHDPHLVAALAARALVLRAGRIVAEGPATEVLADQLAASADPGPEDLDAPGGPVVAVRGLEARHGRARILTGVDLDVAAGECVALVGASGAGKSTLARCLAGLHPVFGGTRRGAAPRAVGLVPQDAVGALNPRETVRRALRRAGPSLDPAELLARVHLGPELLDRRPDALSGGERQRVALARALAADPQVLLCDEVTASLDPATAAVVADLLDELRRTAGLALVVVTHDLSLARRVAHRVVVLDGGTVVESGPAARVLHHPVHPATRALVSAAPELVADHTARSS